MSRNPEIGTAIASTMLDVNSRADQAELAIIQLAHDFVIYAHPIGTAAALYFRDLFQVRLDEWTKAVLDEN